MPNNKKWSEYEIDIILETILYKRVKVLNEIVDLLNNKTLLELVKFLSEELIIGRQEQLVEVQCSYCGKPKKVKKYLYLRQDDHFCNGSCSTKYKNEFGVWKDRSYEQYKNGVYLTCDYCGREYYVNQSKLKRVENEQGFHCCSLECKRQYMNKYVIKRGADNPQFKRVVTKCSYCGKEIEIHEYRTKKVNKHGETNNFCSEECRDRYKSTYSGERACTREYFDNPDNKERISENARKGARAAQIKGTKMTGIHKAVNDILGTNKIKYENEKMCMFYSVDIWLSEYNLYIEIMGDYYHSTPLKYSLDSLNDTQKNVLRYDKAKRTNMFINNNIPILYLWETDINKRPEVCEALIKFYIENNGRLENYNSFNYNEDLTLKEKNILPYFEQK